MNNYRVDDDLAKVVMMTATIAALILGLIFSGGCASNGRVAVIDWDSRDAAQIEAAQYEDGCIYGDNCDDTQAKSSERAFSAWAELFNMIAAIKVRIRVISVEWAAKD